MKAAMGLLCVVLCLVAYAPAVGQQAESCPDIVQRAIEATNELCASVGSNEACYGNVTIQAEPRESVDPENFVFEAPGDIAAVGDIRAITLSSLMEEDESWGVALMRLQAMLPGTIPGQSVVMVMFGDVTITDATEDADAADTNTEAPNPMQAFYFQSGIGDAPCAEAPDSGILIRTPEGMGQVELTVNGAFIRLGSTAYLQAQPQSDASDGAMTITLLDGEAQVEAEGFIAIVPAGNQVTVPLDEDGVASGPPGPVQPFDADAYANLPLALLDESDTEAASGSGLLQPGPWSITMVSGDPCGIYDGVITETTVSLVMLDMDDPDLAGWAANWFVDDLPAFDELNAQFDATGEFIYAVFQEVVAEIANLSFDFGLDQGLTYTIPGEYNFDDSTVAFGIILESTIRMTGTFTTTCDAIVFTLEADA